MVGNIINQTEFLNHYIDKNDYQALAS